jgi:hypothetical protein
MEKDARKTMLFALLAPDALHLISHDASLPIAF